MKAGRPHLKDVDVYDLIFFLKLHAARFMMVLLHINVGITLDLNTRVDIYIMVIC